MNVIRRLSNLRQPFKRPVVAMGVFDGLHHGHRKLIVKAVRRARLIDGEVVVMTFDPHPRRVICPQENLPLISSLAYRLKLFEEMGVGACILVRFTKSFSSMEPSAFVEQYLKRRIGAAEIVVGDDFFFGKDRRGNIKTLQELGNKYQFKVHVIATHQKGMKQISSSRIRNFIRQGDIGHAQDLLDRPVAVYGRVVRGDHRGRLLGYPTANLDPHATGMAPIGVYCVRVTFKEHVYFGMANIGHRPSFKAKAPVNIEVHIFDFKGDLYGKNILVEFLNHIRDERPFSDKESLIRQLHLDAALVKEWFAKNASAS